MFVPAEALKGAVLEALLACFDDRTLGGWDCSFKLEVRRGAMTTGITPSARSCFLDLAFSVALVVTVPFEAADVVESMRGRWGTGFLSILNLLDLCALSSCSVTGGRDCTGSCGG